MRTKTKRNILYAVLLVILFVILALFCGYKIITRIKEENEQKARLAMASANAVGYVREKYGFESEIADFDDSNDENYAELFNKYSENTRIIKMEADGRDFLIAADCLKENPYCIDNYQYEEIQSVIIDEILKGIPGGELVAAEWSGHENMPYDDNPLILNAFNKYFDGGNIDEFIGKGNGTVEMVFADTDFSDMDILDWLTERNIDAEFTSFDTEERLAEFKSAPSEELSFRYYSGYAKYAPYITDHLTIKNGKKQGLNISFQSYGDFIYSYFPAENDGFPVSCEVNATELLEGSTTMADIFARYDEGEYVSKPLTKEYYFDCGYGDVYIYYPLEKLKDYDIENIGAAWFSRGGQSNNRNIEKLSVCGDYAVFRLPFSEISFMLVDTSGYDKYGFTVWR